MNQSELQNTIVAILRKIAPETDPTTLKPGDNIRETLMIDSFDFLRFIVALDKQLGIETPEEDYGKFRTMEKAIAYLQEKSAQKENHV